MADKKTKNGIIVDIPGTECSPEDGVDVKSTKQLTGLGDNPSGFGAAPSTDAYVTGGKSPCGGDI